jgi:3'-phosphoadenosine 5'-phosphosulfate sulfotransferase (PAPS reductase)/FAD synthetase
MVILDELHRLGLLTTNPTVVTIDTLHLFPETYALIQAAQAKYSPPMRLKVMLPRGFDSREQFEQQFGPRLWERRTKMCVHPPSLAPA